MVRRELYTVNSGRDYCSVRTALQYWQTQHCTVIITFTSLTGSTKRCTF